MAETAWPFDSAPTYEDAWRAMARLWQASGVVGTTRGPTDTALRASLSSGVSFVTQPGAALLFGHMYNSTVAETTTAASTNSSSTNSRIDTLVLRMDVTANTITRTVVQGTPASSPVPPALSAGPTVWDLPIASATLPPNVSAQNYHTLVDFRRYAGATIAVSYDTAGYVDQDLRRGDMWLLLQKLYLSVVDKDGTLRGVTNDRLVSVDATAQGASNGDPVSLCSVAVDAPWPYRLECHAQADIGSQAGSRADIVCRLDSTSGTVVSGFGMGKDGAGHQATCIPRANGPFTGAHTVHLVCQRTYGGGSWTNDAFNGYLTVRIVPYIP